MTEVNLKTLVYSTQCDYQFGGNVSHSAFSAAALSHSLHRTVELHNDGVLYLFEEPLRSMAKHLREKIYVQSCRVLDVGSVQEKECLALFLCDYDYAERVDDFGNAKGTFFTRFLSKGAKAAMKTEKHSLSPQPVSKAVQEAMKGYYMVLLFMVDKKTKWHLLKAVQYYSLEYPFLESSTANASPISPGRPAVNGGAEAATENRSTSHPARATRAVGPVGATPVIRNRFTEKLNVKVRVASPTPRDVEEGATRGASVASPKSPSESSTTTVLSDHEVLQLEDVLKAYEDKVQFKEPRADSFAGAVSSRAQCSTGAIGDSKTVRQGKDQEELLPDESTPAVVSESSAAGNGSLAEQGPASVSANTDGQCPARLFKSPLYRTCIEGRPDNHVCADCDEVFPTWCVLRPFGCFVCINCVGVHRELWSNRCREAEMDKWEAADVEYMASRGNSVVNAALEYCIAYPAGSVAAALGEVAVKPSGKQTPAAQRAKYIQQKYEEKLFSRAQHPETAASTSEGDGSTGEVEAGEADRYLSSPSSPSPVALHAPGVLLDSPLSGCPALTAGSDGPPQYCGLADILVKELVTPTESYPGATCTITNGFQALRTKAGRKLVNLPTSTAWDEHLQVGVEKTNKPLYCAVHNAKLELLAAAEFHLPPAIVGPEAACMIAVEMPWCELNKKASARREGEVWQVTMLTSFRALL